MLTEESKDVGVLVNPVKGFLWGHSGKLGEERGDID